MTCRSDSKIPIGKIPIKLSDILNRVSEEDILAYYFNVYKLPVLISSPLRKDQNPSFSIYIDKHNHVRCYDFGIKRGYGVFDLLMEYLHLTFSQTLERIWCDMCHISVKTPVKNRQLKVQKTRVIKLEVKTRNFQNHDLEFWSGFGISQPWLRFGRVFAISDIIFIRNNKTDYIAADKYAYVFVEFKDNIQSLKIYQPYNKQYKWMSDGNSSIWNLWTQLPEKADKLIITSSLKDALCLWANLGIPSCCLQSEMTIPKRQVMEQLKLRFNNIYILYDNDCRKPVNTGQIQAQTISETYDLHNVCIEEKYSVKDPSDFYKKYGRIAFLNYFNNLIK